MLGDPTPGRNGFMSRNPLAYLEPIGFIMTVIFGFGWGRPTPTSPLYYKDKQKGILITYTTPSLVNLFAGLLAALIVGIFSGPVIQSMIAIHPMASGTAAWLFYFINSFAMVSVSVALFNLIPVPPLDAAKILQAALSPNAAVKMTQYEKVLQVALMLLIVMGVIGGVILPIASQIVRMSSFW